MRLSLALKGLKWFFVGTALGLSALSFAARDRDVKRLAQEISGIAWDRACRIDVSYVKRKNDGKDFNLVVQDFSGRRAKDLEFDECDRDGREVDCVRIEEFDETGGRKHCKMDRLFYKRGDLRKHELPRLVYETIELEDVRDRKDCTERFFSRRANRRNTETHMDTAKERRCGR